MQGRLVVDVASAAERLHESDVRDWAAGKRIFLSSVIRALTEERVAAARAITTTGADVVMFERFGGRDEAADAAYLTEVGSSDIYVGILGAEYGVALASGRSATHDEYVEATSRGLRISVWVDTTKQMVPDQLEFLRTIRAAHTTGQFRSPAELERALTTRIAELAAEDLSPWAKLGPAIFRARRVEESSRDIQIHAAVRDADVVESLRALAPGAARLGAGTVLLTVGGRTRKVVVKEVGVTTSAGVRREVTLSLEARGAPTDSSMGATLNTGGKTYSQMELAEMALRRAFGESDRELDAVAFMADIGKPLSDVGSWRLPEAALTSVAGLLVSESLIANGMSGRVTLFNLGPIVDGKRLVSIEWDGVARYTGIEPERRRMDRAVDWRKIT